MIRRSALPALNSRLPERRWTRTYDRRRHLKWRMSIETMGVSKQTPVVPIIFSSASEVQQGPTLELLRLLDAFQQNGIREIPCKGPVLAEIAYGSLAPREFLDIDILVPRQEIFRARDVLIEEGSRWCKHYSNPQDEESLEVLSAGREDCCCACVFTLQNITGHNCSGCATGPYLACSEPAELPGSLVTRSWRCSQV